GDRGLILRRHACVRHQSDIRTKQLWVSTDELLQMRAANLLLTLEEAFDVDRRIPGTVQVGADGLQVNQQLSLIVACATAVNIATANNGIEGRRTPFFERLRRLHVVVAVYENGW